MIRLLFCILILAIVILYALTIEVSQIKRLHIPDKEVNNAFSGLEGDKNDD